MIVNVMDSTSLLTRFLTLVLVSSFATGCLKTREDLRGEGRPRSQDVAAMQKAAAQDMQKAEKNDTNNRFSEIEASIREMNGRVEVVENKVGQNDQREGQSQRQLQEQLQEHNRKMTLLQEEMAKLEGQVQALNDQVTTLKTAPPPPEDKPSKNDKKQDAFETAEDLFEKKEWKRAIVSYQKYRDQSPKGKNFAEATYKIGVCFQELGMKDEAKTFYEEVTHKFNNSSESKRAKIRLKKL